MIKTLLVIMGSIIGGVGIIINDYTNGFKFQFVKNKRHKKMLEDISDVFIIVALLMILLAVFL